MVDHIQSLLSLIEYSFTSEEWLCDTLMLRPLSLFNHLTIHVLSFRFNHLSFDIIYMCVSVCVRMII